MSCKVENLKKDRTETQKNIRDLQKYYKIVNDSQHVDEDRLDYSDFSKRILSAKQVTLIGGPFHYHLRSGTYGEVHDEIPWKVRMGMTGPKPRHGYDDNPLVCKYEPRVIMKNWVEERSDRNYIKYNRPRVSQFGHNYVSETARAYAKPVCNRARDVLLDVATFPITAHPGHQPELSPNTLVMSAPKPDQCCIDETVAKCKKQMEKDKRYYKASL